MCGFGGGCSLKREFRRADVAAAAAAVRFRGPDNTSVAITDLRRRPGLDSGPVALFHNRLSVIDLSPAAHQPMTDEASGATLVYNGEIYNYRELRSELKALGRRFATGSDSEVVLQAYLQWGEACVERLRGMFAFCLVDFADEKLFLARDRLGIKPLVYRLDERELLFASELGSVARLSDERLALDTEAVPAYLLLQYFPAPRTVYRGVRKLAPGHCLTVSWKGGALKASERRYWDYLEHARPTRRGSAEDLARELGERLDQALRLHLVADVPVGLFLSSGVDSSLLAALLRAAGRSPELFTVGFQEACAEDESAQAAAFARSLGFERHHVLPLGPADLLAAAGRCYPFFDEPFADSSCLLAMELSRRTRERVKVALSGDELFWGYPRYAAWERMRRRSRRVPRALKGALAGLARVPNERAAYHLDFLATGSDLEVYLKQLFASWPSALYRGMLRPAFDRVAPWGFSAEGPAEPEGLPGHVDARTYLPGDILCKMDRASMAYGLEVRVPFLDHELVEFAAGIPAGLKKGMSGEGPGGACLKAIPKTLLKALTPSMDASAAADAPKRGFSMPMRRWSRGFLRDLIRSTLDDAALADFGLDPALFRPPVEEHFSGAADRTGVVWTLFNLCLWLKRGRG